MKNYLRHNFRRHCPSGRPRISILKDQAQDLKYSTDFFSPLKSIILGFIPEKYQRSGVGIAEINEKPKKNYGWLDNLFWNQNTTSTLKWDLVESKYAPLKDNCHAFKFGNHLKKYFSACNFCDKVYITYHKRNHKSAENIGLSINCENPLKELNLTTKLNSFAPNVNNCPNNARYLKCNRSRSHSNPCLRNNFLRPCNEISDNGSRSFTTLRAKSESPKPTTPDPSNVPRNIHRSGNVDLLADSKQVAPKPTERDPAVAYEKLKKRDFDWINSFSSEAVILQPSRGEFSIKKLINKTTCQERLWGLPPRQPFAKTLGPGMNDNLIQYTALKHKMQSKFKKNNFIGEGIATTQKVKQLIKSANEKNREFELKKKNDLSTKSKARNMYKTIKDSMTLKPIDILKTKEKIARNNEVRHLQKADKKRSILNFRLPNLDVKEKQKKLLGKDEPINKPSVTEYQSSASYKHVFQELLSKANKTKFPPKPASALSFFNRQQSFRNFSRPASKLSSDNTTKKKTVLKKPEQSSTVSERNSNVNLKNQARTPFQKPSNTQLTSKSKASFSTVSKIPKVTGKSAVSRLSLLKNTKNKPSLPKPKTSQRSISTNRKGNEGNKQVIKKTLYSTLGYYPSLPKKIDMKPKKKLKNTKNNSVPPEKNVTKKENKSHTQSANPNSGYFSQRRSLSSFGLQIGNITEMNKSIRTLNDPPNEQVFNEVMNLCKRQPTTEKTPSSEKEKSFKRYGRCSLQEKKKPERRRGFVCKIASMLNIGCARRRRLNQGCPECGKKAG